MIQRLLDQPHPLTPNHKLLQSRHPQCDGSKFYQATKNEL